jgi:hypothetical protein
VTFTKHAHIGFAHGWIKHNGEPIAENQVEAGNFS